MVCSQKALWRKEMNKRKYIATDITYFFIIVVFTLGLIFIISEDEYVFGSLVDWISQHTVFPEYFRQQFYDTGNLIPMFNMNLGAGQNGYNIAYHGMLNPIVMISYLFPFVDMVTYTIISSVVLIIISAILLYFWLKNNAVRSEVALCVALLFVTSGPMLFHAHRQLVFIQYMPFLIMALMGVDNYIKKKKAKLLIISIFLIYLTNYYFSIGAIVVITLYAIYKFLYQLDVKKQSFTWKAFFEVGLRYALYVIIPTMMSMILLLPTFLALLNGRDENPTNNGFKLSYMLPDASIGVIFYSAYSLGATAVFIFALIDFIRSKKKSKKFLGLSLSIVILFPVVRFFLNAGLYVRAKAILPFLPLALYAVGIFVNRLYRKKIEYKKMIYSAVAVYFIFLAFNINKVVFIGFTADFVMTILAFSIYKKYKKFSIVFATLILISTSACIIMNSTEIKVKEKYMETLWQEDRKEAINYTIENDNEFFRMNTLNDYRYNCNQYINERYYQTSLYSSVYNKYFNELIQETLNLTNPTLNRISSINMSNILFETLMGIKYIEGYDYTIPVGFEESEKKGEYEISKNDNVYSLGFATANTMSYDVFENLSSNEKQMALLKYIVTEKGENVEYKDYFTKLDVDIDFGNEFKKGENYYIELSEEKSIKADLSKYNYNIYAVNIFLEKVEKEKVTIYVNNINNTLSGEDAAFVNNNLDFGYMVSSNDVINELNIRLSKGNYVITGYEVHGLNYSDVLMLREGFDMMKNIEIKDNIITGSIDVKNDGYFNITIPYDEGFSLYVDDVETKIEMTDSAFMGCAISKGSHNIRLEYIAPGYKIGLVITIAGCILFAAVICFDLKASLNRQGKIHN